MPNSRRSDVFGLGNSFSIGLPSVGAEALGDEIYYLPGFPWHTPSDWCTHPRRRSQGAEQRRHLQAAQHQRRLPVLGDHPAPRDGAGRAWCRGARAPPGRKSKALLVTRTAAMTSLLASNLRGFGRGGVPARCLRTSWPTTVAIDHQRTANSTGCRRSREQREDDRRTALAPGHLLMSAEQCSPSPKRRDRPKAVSAARPAPAPQIRPTCQQHCSIAATQASSALTASKFSLPPPVVMYARLKYD